MRRRLLSALVFALLRRVLIASAITGSASLLVQPAAAADTILQHLHGLAFTPDGKGLMAPGQVGLMLYRNGRWRKLPGPAHDFKGLSLAKSAIYTSGRPAPGSHLLTPLGLVKSADGGATWLQLGLSGESNFQLIAAGYRSNIVYVANTEINSRMQHRAVYYTRDEGKSWNPTNAAALSRLTTSIAAHPSHAGTVAIGTADGVYLSRNFGAVFQRVGPNTAVSALAFDFDGKHLYVARGDAGALERMSLDVPGETNIFLPSLEGDFVTYVAQNPARPSELAIATRRRHVFLTTGADRNWKQIARDGQAL